MARSSSVSWVAGRADPEMALWSRGVLGGGGYTVLTWYLDFLKTLWAAWLELIFLLITGHLNLDCPDFSVHVPHGQSHVLGWAGSWLSSVSLFVHDSFLNVLSCLQSLAHFLCFKSILVATEQFGDSDRVELGEFQGDVGGSVVRPSLGPL